MVGRNEIREVLSHRCSMMSLRMPFPDLIGYQEVIQGNLPLVYPDATIFE